MIVEIITTGTELLLGEIVNENSCWLARFLNEHGYTVAYMTTVGDNPDRMKNAFITAFGRADIVITSGGLGSTLGDITKKAGPVRWDCSWCMWNQNIRGCAPIMNI